MSSASPSTTPVVADSEASSGTAAHSPRGPFVALVILLGIVLAMPFLIGFQSPLHFVIVGFALYEAWKLNRAPAFTITGPYQIASAT